MKVAYILFPDVVISNRSNGVRHQAETWAALLRKQNVEVDYINNWDDYCWADYEIIHIFGEGKWMYNVVKRLSSINSNIVLSPIIDPIYTQNLFLKNKIKRWLQKITSNKFQWFYSDQIKTLPYIKRVLVRSEFEKEFVVRAWGYPEEKIDLVPLSYSYMCKQPDFNLQKKEAFCLHISSIYQERKNVIRLVEAARKYNFKLVLAGNLGTEQQYQPIKKAIANSTNIQVLGYISEEEKVLLYKKAKVFALPSLYEGVGIVALDAALYGCEIVITNIPGPKEYYNGKCVEVSPYDVDSIGMAISDFLTGRKGYQPDLSKDVSERYSSSEVVQRLITAYKKISK